MTADELKTELQTLIEQDYDALFEEYERETGGSDLLGFVNHLTNFGLLEPQVADAIRLKLTPSAPPQWTGSGPQPPASPQTFDELEDEELKTVVGTPYDLGIEEEEAGEEETMPPESASPAKHSGPGRAVAGPGIAAESVPDPGADEETANALDLGTLPSPGPDHESEWEDSEENRTRRTMFKRLSGGGWKESTTDVHTVERRRRRRVPKDSKPKVGEAGRYTFESIVGEGAMGKVHLARDTKLHRSVAFKAMSQEIAEHKTLASKFSAEAQITAQLDHPNIVPIYNLESTSSYTMKLIKGQTIQDILTEVVDLTQARQVLPENLELPARLDLFLKACDAMYYAHSRGVVHRDLKPENVMVGAFNELYVMDWGIARLMNKPVVEPVDLGTVPAEEGDLVIGTPGYMSPEQAEGRNSDLDGKSDQYSMGLILFELVSLRPAVTGKAPLKMVMRHQDGEKDPLVHLRNEKIPSALKAIIHKATAKKPENRYDNVKALGDDIRNFLRGDPILAAPDNLVQAAFRWMAKHRQITALVVMGLFMGSALLAVTAIAWSQLSLASARAREQQVSNLLATAGAQSSLIDGQFVKYEGLLSVISTHAEDTLARAPMSATIFLDQDFDGTGNGSVTPTLIDSERYGRKISLKEAAYVLAPGTNENNVRGSMTQLDTLERHFYRVLLRSHSEGAATYTPKRAQRALAEVGVPLARAYVGLNNGVYAAYPGHGGWPEAFDHRETPWFELAQKRRGPIWGAPSPDLHGLGLVLTCAQALYDTEDNLLGVAGIDVTFDYIIEELLELPETVDIESVESYLLDPSGNIVIGSRHHETVSVDSFKLQPFHNANVLSAIKEKRSGHLIEKGELILYNRMHSIGWYYVVVGPEGDLL